MQDHREVLEAFRNGSARTARAAMTRHVEHAGELLAKHIETASSQAAQLTAAARLLELPLTRASQEPSRDQARAVTSTGWSRSSS